MNTINEVMRHGVKHGWTEDQLVAELKKRFRRMRNLRHVRESYREMLKDK